MNIIQLCRSSFFSQINKFAYEFNCKTVNVRFELFEQSLGTCGNVYALALQDLWPPGAMVKFAALSSV